MFSLLSQGYGTFDGKAKKDAQETREHKEYFSLEDLHLPPIGSNYQALAQRDIGEYYSGPRYENKPFTLPKVEDTKYNLRNVPKTYTTRKGALLLYAEDFFMPGSPKPRKRRRKFKKQPTMKLKTIGDLRNYILDYRNGGDPLFLALLEKRMSGHKEQSVRPGFSPKRYIATLGNSLEEDTWNRLAAKGSFKDPSLLTHVPQRTPMHGEAVCSLFPGKPQPYSTMSLPPISPSSSMLESSFHFYKNGMSTGAASMITLNSESEEYAPSSRALSPAESLNDRLSEVEFLPQRKDQYTQLNSTQKENLLSQLLLQRTLESMNSDLSDLQGWVTNYPETGEGMEKDSVSVATLSKSKAKHRGSLKSGSLSSIPRLPPIQSAGARPSTPIEFKEEESPLPKTSMEQTIHQQLDITTEKDGTNDVIDPSSVHLDLSSFLANESTPFVDEGDLQGRSQSDGDISYSEETTADIKDNMKHVDQTDNANQSVTSGKSSEGTILESVTPGGPGIEGKPNRQRENSGCENSVEDQVTITNDVIALDDIVLSEDTIYDDKRLSTQEEEIKHHHKQTLENVDQTDEHTGDDSQPQVQKMEKAELDHTHTEADDKDEGIGIDEGVVDRSEEMAVADDDLAITEEGIQASQENNSLPPVEPSPPLSLEELQEEAQTVASKVLSRPQSGMVFMEDIKAAIAMWADRLTHLLGPPRRATRVSSANHQRQHSAHLTAKEGSLRLVRHRKLSRSAGPSPAALREALTISGGEVMEMEALKNLPPIPKRLSKTGQSQPPGPDTNVYKYYENLKDGSASTKRSGSSNTAQSIPWERVSNADVQVDVFSYATKEEEPSFHRVLFNEINDEESDDEDKEFKTALDAVVTEVKQEYTLFEAKSRMATSSPKKEQKPFQFPRPAESKPPAGLQNKQTQGQVKGKAKTVTAKKQPLGKKKAGKKPTKQTSKASNKTSKTRKGKEETQKKEQENQEKVSNATVTEEEKLEPLRVDSETGEHELETSQRTVVSSALSFSRASSKASDKLSEKKTSDSPSEPNTTPIVEVPFLAPKAPEPQDIQQELEPEPGGERTPEPEGQKPAHESRAARRAAERAAAAERRRQEVERKRREREEAKKRAAEEETRLQQLRLEAEEEMKKREEELRRRREAKEEAKRREQEEEMEQERLASIKAERERRAKEDWKKRQQQVLAQRKLEEELRKEQEKIEAELEAARLREEEERIKAMEESERIAFLEKMRQEEEELRRRLEEQGRKEEHERKIREEERKQREDALALLRQKHLQRHLFIAGILKESHYFSLSQRLTKAFTFSYFDLIPWNHLQHLKPPPSPVRDLLHSLRDNIPPTILEEDEETED